MLLTNDHLTPDISTHPRAAQRSKTLPSLLPGAGRALELARSQETSSKNTFMVRLALVQSSMAGRLAGWLAGWSGLAGLVWSGLLADPGQIGRMVGARC